MTILLLLVGAIVGAVLGAISGNNTAGLGTFLGAALGFTLARIQLLRNRMAALERQVQTLQTNAGARGVSAARDVARNPAAVVTEPLTPSASAPAAMPVPVMEIPTPVPTPNRAVFTATEPSVTAPRVEPMPAPPPREVFEKVPPRPVPPVPGERLLGAIKNWFTTGNVPVKIGVIVLFLGVGALLKYASEQGWMHFPIEMRFIAVAIAAIAALAFAWRQRVAKRSFSLSLQGGAIGILILDVFGAFQLHLLPPTAAFALLVILVAGSGLLAVLQDALALAVLGSVGGFLAPILVSSGQEAHVALFSYYAILNAAIFGIAWMRPWRILNLVGFAFTFGIGTMWGVLQYKPEFFATTEPFLILFAAFYLIIPVLYALRQAPERRGLVDGTLVFGTPLLAFPLQAALLHGDRIALAYSALVVAAVYAVLAAMERRRDGLRLLSQSHAILALGFATLAVPLGLSARVTACSWALEGAALVWLGLRQETKFPRYIGYVLQIAAGLAYIVGIGGVTDARPILNGDFLGAALIAGAGLVTSRLIYRRDARAPLAVMFFLWALGWWSFCGLQDILRYADDANIVNWLLLFLAVSGVFFAELASALAWPLCLWPAAAAIVFALPLVFPGSLAERGPLEGYNLLGWIAWTAAALRILARPFDGAPRLRQIAHLFFLATLTLVGASEAGHVVHRYAQLNELWTVLASLAVPAAMFWLVLKRNVAARFPLGDAAEGTRSICLAGLGLVLGFAAFAGLVAEGDPRPLPYLPLLNPLELAQGFALLSLLAWYRQANAEGTAVLDEKQRAPLLALAGFALLTMITLRTVHFFTGAPWNESLFASIVAQASLSVVWSIAGLTAMLIGARRGSRPIWIGGAVLMAVVLGKLALIDRHHLGDLAGIVSFLAVGVLLLVVGYYSPVPPRTVLVEEAP